MRRELRIFCDYGAEWPLWEIGMICPEDYGISQPLAARLAKWNEQFQENLHWEKGWQNGFDDAGWNRRGQELARDVQREVGGEVNVVYL